MLVRAIISIACLIGMGYCQDYRLMYEPIYPSGMSHLMKEEPFGKQSQFAPYMGGGSWGGQTDFSPYINDMQQRQQQLLEQSTTLGTRTLNNKQEVGPNGGGTVQRNSPSPTAPEMVLSGLHGTVCKDLYLQCPEFAESNYCTKYRKQMLYQCRRTCGFCDIDPNKEKEEDQGSGEEKENASGDEDEESGETNPTHSDQEDEHLQSGKKRSLIPLMPVTSASSSTRGFQPEDEKHFIALKSRFKMPGFVPSLEDLYAEIGTLHPSEMKLGETKTKTDKSQQLSKRNKVSTKPRDPFKYLKDKIPGSSIQPIVDVQSLSITKVQRSNPVYVVKNTVRSRRSVVMPESLEKKQELVGSDTIPDRLG